MPDPETPLPPEMTVIDRLHTRKHVRSERCQECHQFYPCHARMVLDVLQRHRAALECYAGLLTSGGTPGDENVTLLREHATLARQVLNGEYPRA